MVEHEALKVRYINNIFLATPMETYANHLIFMDNNSVWHLGKRDESSIIRKIDWRPAWEYSWEGIQDEMPSLHGYHDSRFIIAITETTHTFPFYFLCHFIHPLLAKERHKLELGFGKYGLSASWRW